MKGVNALVTNLQREERRAHSLIHGGRVELNEYSRRIARDLLLSLRRSTRLARRLEPYEKIRQEVTREH
jgi:hypothetical protein